jgi:hypothetical protein
MCDSVRLLFFFFLAGKKKKIFPASPGTETSAEVLVGPPGG